MPTMESMVNRQAHAEIVAAERTVAAAAQALEEALGRLREQRELVEVTEELAGPVAHPEVGPLDYSDLLNVEPHADED